MNIRHGRTLAIANKPDRVPIQWHNTVPYSTQVLPHNFIAIPVEMFEENRKEGKIHVSADEEPGAGNLFLGVEVTYMTA